MTVKETETEKSNRKEELILAKSGGDEADVRRLMEGGEEGPGSLTEKGWAGRGENSIPKLRPESELPPARKGLPGRKVAAQKKVEKLTALAENTRFLDTLEAAAKRGVFSRGGGGGSSKGKQEK